ncbi:hypothetical protein [Micromonospora sp. NPDC093277]|uniref:hypothetical protein n=1 Tax=Micromonospora sp. NPDC093277 TaxID=3364291 RepID=UPI00380359FD
MAVAELRYLRLDWVTADPLPYVSSTYTCFRHSAARNRPGSADAVPGAPGPRPAPAAHLRRRLTEV